MTNTPTQILQGGLAIDDRGELRYCNNASFLKRIKRFYQVSNYDTDTIRAFHGHMREDKYVYVCNGSILLCLAKLDKTERPSKKAKIERFVLSSNKPQVLHIPKGYANGFRSLTPNSIVLFFSTATLEESMNDDYRYPFDYWGEKIWNVENR